MNNNVCLVVIFNHNYEKNLDKLRKIYGNRFSNLYFLMPFYTGNDSDVISIYEGSYEYSGYIAQAYSKIKNDKYSHYIFLADDLLLNPKFDENNIISKMGLGLDDSYIKSYDPVGWSPYIGYLRLKSVYDGFSSASVEYKKIINNSERANNLLNNQLKTNTDYTKVKFKYIKNNLKSMITGLNFFRTLFILLKNKFRLPYPFVNHFSDFIIISNKDINKCVQEFGVFAAMNVFVEIVIPTVMLTNCKNVVFEKNIVMKGKEYWGNDIKTMEENNSYSIKKLYNNWGDNQIYIHPIKLSKWSMIDEKDE